MQSESVEPTTPEAVSRIAAAVGGEVSAAGPRRIEIVHRAGE